MTSTDDLWISGNRLDNVPNLVSQSLFRRAIKIRGINDKGEWVEEIIHLNGLNPTTTREKYRFVEWPLPTT